MPRLSLKFSVTWNPFVDTRSVVSWR